jgi:hypothetical protein
MLSSREDHRQSSVYCQSSEFGSPRREFAQLDPKSLADHVSPEKESDLYFDSNSSLQKELQKGHELEHPGPEEDFER